MFYQHDVRSYATHWLSFPLTRTALAARCPPKVSDMGSCLGVHCGFTVYTHNARPHSPIVVQLSPYLAHQRSIDMAGSLVFRCDFSEFHSTVVLASSIEFSRRNPGTGFLAACTAPASSFLSGHPPGGTLLSWSQITFLSDQMWDCLSAGFASVGPLCGQVLIGPVHMPERDDGLDCSSSTALNPDCRV